MRNHPGSRHPHLDAAALTMRSLRPLSDVARPRRTAVLAVAALILALVPGCNRDKVEGEGRLEPEGRVLLTRDDKPTTVSRARTLVRGDAVEVADGSAKVTLPGGDVLELRPRSVLVLNDGPELRTGTVLVTATQAPRQIRAAGSQVDAVGATRLDVTQAVRVVSYAGRAVVRSGGRTLELEALRETLVPGVGVLREPGPLAIDRADPWDRRLLGDAVSREAALESLADGFTGQVAADDADSVGYYRGLLPDLARHQAFDQGAVTRLGLGTMSPTERARADPSRPSRAGDVLLGAAVALKGGRGTFDERLAGAATFRGQGASWSLVALDQQVPSFGDLTALVDGAVNDAPLELAARGPQTPSAVPAPVPAPVTTRPQASRSASTTRPRQTTTTAPQPQPQPQPQPSRPPIVLPVGPLLDTTVDPVADLLNDLLGTNRR